MFSLIDFYQLHAEAWSRIFRTLRRPERIVDLHPQSPKIEIALAHLGFTGELLLVDRGVEAMEAMRSFMRIFKQPYSIRAECKDVFDAPSLLGDWVVADNIFGQIILGQYGDVRGVHGDAAQQLETQGRLRGLAKKVARALARHLKSNGTLMITHFPTYLDGLFSNTRFGGQVDDLFELTRTALSEEQLRETPLGARIEGIRGYRYHG